MLSNVHFGYEAGAEVIRGVSAELRQGSVCALIGPNAAGKSTLIELMLGQRAPWVGEVVLNRKRAGEADGWERVVEMKAWERARWLAYVPQRALENVGLRVGEVVALGRYAQPRGAAAVDEAIRLCDLGSVRGRVFSELSVGQQQRVAVARAVAQLWSDGDLSGRFMLLDEPVNAMDLRHVDHTLQVLRSLASRGLGVLVVLHDLNLASMYADEAWLLSEGQLAAAGRCEEVLRAEVLEPAYGVRLSTAGEGKRTMFFVEPGRGV
jgi:iron complex transport system ATP-binding protein